MAAFDKVRAMSLTDSVKQELLQKILSGELQPGTRLPSERYLAERMGISRSSLHQSVLALENEGFLSIIPRRGIVVNDFRSQPTAQSLAALMSYGSLELDYSLFSDMMDTRLWLESECARRACTHATPELLSEMEELVDRMSRSDADLADIIYTYHFKLVQASGNSLYSMIFRGFESVLRTMIAKHYAIRSNDLTACISMSRELIEVIRQGRSQDASELVCRLIGEGIDALRQRYNDN